MAAQHLLKVYRAESLNHTEGIINALLSFVLNQNDIDYHYSLQSQNSPKPVVFYSQIANIVSQDLMEKGEAFKNRIEERALQMLAKYEFASGCFPFFGPSTIQFLTFLSS